jgi:hypothetical protein
MMKSLKSLLSIAWMNDRCPLHDARRDIGYATSREIVAPMTL